MTKITIAVLTVGAFLYATWLVFLRKPLPDPGGSTGLRKRFLLAVLLFTGLLGASVHGADKKAPMILCYAPPAPDADPRPMTRDEVVAAFKAVWQTLDPARGAEFRQKLEAAAETGAMRKKVANMLAVAFSDLAAHKDRTRGEGPRTTCYEMTILGGAEYTSRENALKQLELLANARSQGRIDAATAAKAQAALAREVEMLHRGHTLNTSGSWREGDRLARQYNNGEIIPGDAAEVTAAMIVEMEDGKVEGLTPAKRLQEMKQRVEDLLQRGPEGNDWIDPAVSPNVSTVLEKAGLIEQRQLVECYMRAAVPVSARGEELQKLQAELLDRNVRAGVLDVETASKAAAATAREPDIDYATEDDIRIYQQQVRRAIRLLYKHGELPSSFVQEIENATDADIIDFESSKALRNDMGYHFRSLLRNPHGTGALKALERRKLIPLAPNHRLVLRHTVDPGLSEEEKQRIGRFEELIDGGGDLSVPGDEEVEIPKWQIPEQDREYRLEMRAVCRALLESGIIRKRDQIQPLEDLIGIPTVGRLEKG